MALDSAKLGSNGVFSFSGKRPESPEFYRLRLDNKVINFSVDSIETLTVKAGANDFATGYSIEGSENNTKIKELVLLLADLQKRVDQLAHNRNIPAGVAQDSLVSMVNNYKNKVKREYIFAAPNMTYAYFALFQALNGYMLFDPLTNKDDVKCFAAVATSLNNTYPHADRSRNLYNMVIKGMKNTRTPRQTELDIPQDKIKEATIIDIELKDIKGNVRRLTDLKGKVILIDFTVYNNAMSAAHNLALRELYNKYASQGLEIYQISLDADEHFWKTSSDNLPWICVRDANGAYSQYVTLYSVTNLPAVFLAVGRIGLRVTTCPRLVLPHTHTGNSGGQVQGFSFLRKAFFTILSSSEWKVMMQSLPPGASRSIKASKEFSNTSSSLLQAIRIA